MNHDWRIRYNHTKMSPIEDKILAQLQKQNLDIRDSGYRYMDQKVTPDVLAFIADCIVNLPSSTRENFTKNDVWNSSYFSKNIVMIFNKPQADNATAIHEYDKFTAQPLKTLSFAGVLAEGKAGRVNTYSVVDEEILEYISLSDRNAFNFLCLYLQEVMKRSGFLSRINNYISTYRSGKFTKSTFDDLKSAFESFMLGNTRINQTTEIRRIFPKVINIFAVYHGVPGSKSGVASDGPYLYSDLMYNDVNFRDLKKMKNVSRQEASIVYQKQKEYSNYEMRKVMDAVRKHHYPNSEVRDSYAQGEATQVHHIFSQSSHPELRSTPENLILLTAQQHNSKAHPSNKTRTTDPDYQIVCLLSKLESVKTSIMNNDGRYTKESFVNIVNQGLGLSLGYDLSFDDIANRLRQYQRQM